MKTICILGATSRIAHETARHFALGGAQLFLAARDEQKLAHVADDLSVYGASRVDRFLFDADDLEYHESVVCAAREALGRIDALLIAYGTLPDQERCEVDVSEARAAFVTNSLSVISLLTLFANVMERQGRGCIAVITSVAGDRGRGSNYVSGASKGAVAIFLQGLRSRLVWAGVSVLTIKPGWIDTPMTATRRKNILFASPARVGRRIYWAMRRREDVVYVPWFWRWIMWAVRSVPEPIFKRLPL